MDDPLLLLLSLGAFLSGVFYAVAEAAQLAVNPTRLEQRLGDATDAEALERLRARDHLHCLILGLLSNLIFVVSLAEHVAGQHVAVRWGVPLGAGLLGPILLGRVLVAAAVHRRPESWYLGTQAWVRLSTQLLGWLTSPLVLLARALTRVRGQSLPLDRPLLLPPDPVTDLMAQGEPPIEQQMEMIERVIDLRDADVDEVMTPRTDMIALPVTATVEQAIAEAVAHGHSRIPVYRTNRDEIVGVLYVKDLLKHWGDPAGELDLSDLVREPVFVPETKAIEELLHEFQQKKVHLAVVIDEYGGTAGVITIEDILEEIVGEIEDEYDRTSGRAPVKQLEADTWDVSAQIHIDELNEQLDLALPEDDDFDTLGGLIFSALGRVPKAGEAVTVGPVELTVLEAGERRIKRVRLVAHRGDPAAA